MGSDLVTDCSILRLQPVSNKTKQSKLCSFDWFVLFVLYFFASCVMPELHISECLILLDHRIINFSHYSEEWDIMTNKNRIFSNMATIPITITDYSLVSVHL